MGEVAWIAHSIHELTAVATAISAAVEQQAMTTRDIADSIQKAAGNTARASTEIQSVGAAQEGATAVGEISGWTTRLSARAQDLESKLARFFSRVRAASGYARPLSALILKRPLLRRVRRSGRLNLLPCSRAPCFARLLSMRPRIAATRQKGV